MNLNEINSEISHLEEKRVKLLNEQKNLDKEKIQSLEWTKNCWATLHINSMVCAGLPTYTINIYGEDIPYTISPITVFNNHNLYEHNVMFGKSYLGVTDYSFYTSSKDALLGFLQVVKFKQLDYNKDWLEVLEAVKGYK